MGRGDIFAGGGSPPSGSTLSIQPAAGTEVLLLMLQAGTSSSSPSIKFQANGTARGFFRGIGLRFSGSVGLALKVADKVPINNTFYPIVAGSGGTIVYSGVQTK